MTDVTETTESTTPDVDDVEEPTSAPADELTADDEPVDDVPAPEATSEDQPTSGELDDGPAEAVAEAVGAQPEDLDAVADAEEEAVVEAEAAADAPAEEADELDDLLGMAGADTDEAAEDPAVAEAAADAAQDIAEDPATEAAPEAEAEPETPRRPRRPQTLADVRDQKDLRRMIGDWFVVHTYAGYEQRVKDNLSNRIETYDAWDRIHEIHIPTEEVTEYKKGKKVVSDKKFLPGYVLVRMDLDDDTWGIVRHTPAVTGFVGANGVKPVPLSLREVANTLRIPKEFVEESEEAGEGAEQAAAPTTPEKPQIEIDMEVGETVRVTTGPFADFTGTIAEINLDQAKLRVMVSVFGRETPVELPFDNVASV